MAHPKGKLLEQLVSRNDVMTTWRSESAAEKGIVVLDQHGIFPLTYSNPQMSYVNLLGLYVYLSGTLNIRESSSYTTVITRKKKQFHGLDDVFKEKLGLTLNTRSDGSMYLSDNGASYARLLHTLGFHINHGSENGKVQRKALHGTTLPPYLVDIVNNYDAFSKTIQRGVRRFVSDFVSVWFDTKTFINPYLSGRINLMGQPTEELFQEQAELFARAIKIVYPEVEIDPQADLIKYEIRGKMSGYFVLTTDRILQFPRHEYSPVR